MKERMPHQINARFGDVEAGRIFHLAQEQDRAPSYIVRELVKWALERVTEPTENINAGADR